MLRLSAQMSNIIAIPNHAGQIMGSMAERWSTSYRAELSVLCWTATVYCSIDPSLIYLRPSRDCVGSSLQSKHPLTILCKVGCYMLREFSQSAYQTAPPVKLSSAWSICWLFSLRFTVRAASGSAVASAVICLAIWCSRMVKLVSFLFLFFSLTCCYLGLILICLPILGKVKILLKYQHKVWRKWHYRTVQAAEGGKLESVLVFYITSKRYTVCI